MNVIVGWIVGNTQSGPHSFRKKKPLGWQYSDGLVTQSYHEAEVARLCAEVEKYRTDARRWRFVASAPGSVTLRIHNTRADGRDEAIDAAMGASA